MLLPEFYVEIPEERKNEAKETAVVLGKKIYENLNFVEGCSTISYDLAELLLNQTWRPGLGVLGAMGFQK